MRERVLTDPLAADFQSANERFKARWDGFVAWSMVVAVSAHAAVFVLWPAWVRMMPGSEPETEFFELEWISAAVAGAAEEAGAANQGMADAGAERSLGAPRRWLRWPPSRRFSGTVSSAAPRRSRW